MTHVLEVKGVTFGYPGCDQIINGVTFALSRGCRLGVAGENGSGKTTLARLACGLLRPTGGAVTVDGIDSGNAGTIHELRRRVGIVFQDPDDQIVETTVEREIAFGPRNLGLGLDEVSRRVDEAISLLGLEGLRRRPCHLLSAGEKQTVAVASVLAMRPEYLILDESTSLLDAASRRQALAAIETLLATTGAGLVFISMRLEDLWMCDETIFLKSGAVAFRGSKAGLLDYLGRDYPLSGTALFASLLAGALPGFGAALAERRSLSGEDLAAALAGRSGSERGPASRLSQDGGTCQS
ncbi:MAG: ATP-binding cassette domain-containing protein [bacterium]